MTNPTLERAARAARESAEKHIPGRDEFPYPGELEDAYRHIARAVLMAVREPGDETGGLVDVGYETMRHREVTTHSDARKCFTAMIDAILNDGGGDA